MSNDNAIPRYACTIVVSADQSWELSVKQLCKRTLPGWQEQEVQAMQVTLFYGVCNKCYKIFPTSTNRCSQRVCLQHHTATDLSLMWP